MRIGKQNRYAVIGVLLLAAVLLGISAFSASVMAATDAHIENNGSRLIIRANGDITSCQWMIADAVDGEYSAIDGASHTYYDITADEEGKYIKAAVDGVETEAIGPIGKLITMDIGQGSISLSASYSGKDSDGNAVSGTHEATNIYVIIHKNSETKTVNNIVFGGNLADKPFDVTLAGVNMGATPTNHNQAPGSGGSGTPSGGEIRIPATGGAVKKVILRLRDENIVRYISYYNGGDTNTPASVASSLKITDINGDGEATGGSLYVPVKLEPEEIEAFVSTRTNYNHWNAGIGGTDGSSLVQNLHIAGGKIQVVTTLGDNCTAIGAGGNGYCQMEISGGEVIAHCNGTGAAIGGGIGWNAAGGKSNVLISGGSVYAKNHAMIQSGTDLVGGVAIGSGSSFYKAGSEGKVTITGGVVEAYGTFGNGIGGGNSSTSTGGKADITISGGTVTATSIGGGNSKAGVGGSADVTVSEYAAVTLLKGIGGGLSEAGDGGAATITVTGGTMNCGGVIGGGNGGGTGNGGKAVITVTSGTLTSQSIGGGTGGAGGHGGAAEIYISGGYIETGSIGGGKTENKTDGKLGYAKAEITGGDIVGQFLMAAGGTESCSFDMTGGTLHGVNTVDGAYAQEDGAAVYMDDPYGAVNISGGVIKDCSAKNGGAIYMSAGTCSISGTAAVENCTSTEDGGAIYLGGGKLTVEDGTIQNNVSERSGGAIYMGGGEMTVSGGTIRSNAAKADGGAIYLGGGKLTVSDGEIVGNQTTGSGGGAFVNGGDVLVSGGSISGNKAAQNGGGVSVNDGNYSMVDGNVDGNSAETGNGGGIYVSANENDVQVGIYSGSVSSNTSGGNGGALAVVGKQDGTRKIQVQIGVQLDHFDSAGNVVCDHDHPGITDETVAQCPQVSGNHASTSGGGVFVTGNSNTELNIYCLKEDDANRNSADGDNEQSNFMKVEGGKVTLTTSSADNMDKDDLQVQDAHHGNTQISSTIYVTGGNMALWGEMTNPSITDVITVDITKAGDSFDDYRLSTKEDDRRFKLKYFENFKDPITQVTTGQYKEYEITYNEWVTISGNIYNHPGYTIIGWNTKKGDPKDNLDNFKQKDHPDQALGWYEVGLDYQFNANPIGDLTIYAIWEPNGYTVVYNANADSYLGEMTDDAFVYNERNTLKKNAYVRPDYDFVGWCVDQEPAEESVIYGDEAVLEQDLTSEKGAVVILYAQWKPCDHNPETHEYTYSVVDDGRTLKRECVCGTYSEETRLTGENCVYDRTSHGASVVYTSKSWSPQPTYEALDEGDELVEGLPYYAGQYKASITENGYTASVTYTIEKAEQPAPSVPIYETRLGDDGSVLSIKPVEPSPWAAADMAGYDCPVEYKLVYYVGGEQKVLTQTTSQSPAQLIDGAYAAQFTVDVVLTNYYVYASYGEGANYKASADAAADSVYFFAGNVEIIINNPEGIRKELTLADGEGENILNNGAQLSLTLLDGYYFPQGYDTAITCETTRLGEETEAYQVNFTTKVSCSDYLITGIRDYTRIMITLPNACRETSASAHIAEGQIFQNIQGTSATISRDSAYTVCFDIRNYVAAEMESPVLSFDKPLPEDTTVIMTDKTNGGYYWKRIDRDGIKELKLIDFVRMGDAKKTPFVLQGENVQLQFVVDFSQTESGMDGEAITSVMTVAAKPASKAQSKNAAAVAMLKAADGFSLTANNGRGLTFRRDRSEGVASKWDYRDSALVFKTAQQLPADARLQFVCGNATEVIYANSSGRFVYSVPAWDEGNVTVSLISNMLPEGATAYDFEVQWLVSESQIERSPINGQLVAKAALNISCQKENAVSLKIIGDKKLYSIGDPVKASVSWLDLPLNCELEVVLMVKSGDGEYSSTGVTKEISFTEETGTQLLEISLAGNNAGSYCLQVTADQGLIRIAKAQYYFLLE